MRVLITSLKSLLYAAHITVLVLLLRAECNSFPIPQQRDRSRVVFALQDTVAYYSNSAGVGPRNVVPSAWSPLCERHISQLSPRIVCWHEVDGCRMNSHFVPNHHSLVIFVMETNRVPCEVRTEVSRRRIAFCKGFRCIRAKPAGSRCVTGI